ncbi:Hsp20/alpha crystallin family protein, partial [Mesorhizobium sp. M1A.T.Ca.IN.004.03.1.1]
GRFERRIPVGTEVKEDQVDATFKNGVLAVTLPKTEKAQSQVKRIAIRS